MIDCKIWYLRQQGADQANAKIICFKATSSFDDIGEIQFLFYFFLFFCNGILFVFPVSGEKKFDLLPEEHIDQTSLGKVFGAQRSTRPQRPPEN